MVKLYERRIICVSNARKKQMCFRVSLLLPCMCTLVRVLLFKAGLGKYLSKRNRAWKMDGSKPRNLWTSFHLKS